MDDFNKMENSTSENKSYVCTESVQTRLNYVLEIAQSNNLSNVTAIPVKGNLKSIY
jgi:hypothetical protein